MITIYIDNQPHQVKEGQNLLQACLSLGFDLPYFCWHPALHSVGACRQCAVKQFKDDKDARGRIVMSCMTPLTEGMRISVDDPEAKTFRAGIIELLMKNHPHDCPVCDEGGECHLQDMTIITGHTYRKSRFKKRTHRNQDLGPFINHEMNRCIACYRCVRFYRGVAGGRDLNVFASHDHVFFGRHEDGMLESEFSGNLVEICPTGAFTDKTLKKHYTRKWDLQTAPSLCVHCSIGCNTIAGERSGKLRRILNRHNSEVNGYFLCDRGRFGYEFVNSDKRIKQAQVRENGELMPVALQAALDRIATSMTKSKTIVGIGSPRASLESNFALRTLVGPDNFFSGMSVQEHSLVSQIIGILRNGPVHTPSLREVRDADAILVLGEDVTNTAPMLALAVRQAARHGQYETAASMKIPNWDDNAVRNAGQDAKSTIFIASLAGTRLDDAAVGSYHASAEDIALLGFAVAHEIDAHAPVVPDSTDDARALAITIAGMLMKAQRPLVISGIGCKNEAVVKAAANVAFSLRAAGKQAALSYVVHECNAIGIGLIAGRNHTDIPRKDIDTLIILENDLYHRMDKEMIDSLLTRTRFVTVLDHVFNATTSKADVILPAATFAESMGSLVSNESRAQRFYQVFQPAGDIQASWKWIDDIMKQSGVRAADSRRSFDDLMEEMADALPIFALVREISPPDDFRIQGMKIPRQSHRFSGRTALTANESVHEPKPADDPDSAMSFSMEGYQGMPPAPLTARYWSPGWNSAQSINKFPQELGETVNGNDTGKRLIEPAMNAKTSFFPVNRKKSIADRQDNEDPYHLFGSEELSMHAPSIANIAKTRNTDNNGKT